MGAVVAADVLVALVVAIPGALALVLAAALDVEGLVVQTALPAQARARVIVIMLVQRQEWLKL